MNITIQKMSDSQQQNMELIAAMETLVASMRSEADKLYNRNVKASAPKLRKQCQDLKNLCQACRNQALTHQKSIPVKAGKPRKTAAAETEADVEADE